MIILFYFKPDPGILYFCHSVLNDFTGLAVAALIA